MCFAALVVVMLSPLAVLLSLSSMSAWCFVKPKDIRGLCDTLIRATQDLERNDIPYFLCYGSLLGQVRSGEPIPWEHDMDICTFAEDWENVTKVLTNGHGYTTRNFARIWEHTRFWGRINHPAWYSTFWWSEVCLHLC